MIQSIVIIYLQLLLTHVFVCVLHTIFRRFIASNTNKLPPLSRYEMYQRKGENFTLETIPTLLLARNSQQRIQVVDKFGTILLLHFSYLILLY